MSGWFGGRQSAPEPSTGASAAQVVPAASPEEEGSSLVSYLDASAFEWAASNAGTAESQVLYVHLDDGSFMFFQVAYSSVGLSPTLMFSLRHARPGKEAINCSASYSFSNAMISPDRRSLTYNADNKILQSVGIGEDGTKQIQYTAECKLNDVRCKLHFTAITPAVQLKQGKTLVGAKDQIVVHHRYIPFGTVRAEFGDGQAVTGSALFVHSLQGGKPHLIATQWQFMSLQNPAERDAVAMCQFVTPAPKNGVGVSVVQGWVVRKGKVVAGFARSGVQVESLKKDGTSGYAVPERVRFVLEGKTAGGSDGDQPIRVEVAAERPAEPPIKVDILGEQPYLIRKVLQAFIAKPFSFMYADKNVPVKCTVDGKEHNFSGHLFQETTIINDS